MRSVLIRHIQALMFTTDFIDDKTNSIFTLTSSLCYRYALLTSLAIHFLLHTPPQVDGYASRRVKPLG